ncbi:MAG: hypothetical protein CMP11_03510 [Zetaproteobacteria bacterium]|nr:hypothetical protein [Pseudobdellovibrionaceae bacterium]
MLKNGIVFSILRQNLCSIKMHQKITKLNKAWHKIQNLLLFEKIFLILFLKVYTMIRILISLILSCSILVPSLCFSSSSKNIFSEARITTLEAYVEMYQGLYQEKNTKTFDCNQYNKHLGDLVDLVKISIHGSQLYLKDLLCFSDRVLPMLLDDMNCMKIGDEGRTHASYLLQKILITQPTKFEEIVKNKKLNLVGKLFECLETNYPINRKVPVKFFWHRLEVSSYFLRKSLEYDHLSSSNLKKLCDLMEKIKTQNSYIIEQIIHINNILEAKENRTRKADTERNENNTSQARKKKVRFVV